MKIHVAVNGQQHGPYELHELNAMLASGSLPAVSSLAWHEGLPDWVPLAAVPGVVLPGAPPVVAAAPTAPGVVPPAASGEGEVLRTVIPYKNPMALAAYYLGIFALVPLLGGVLALPAIGLGIAGLIRCRRNPLLKGTVHAWVGLVLGTLSLAGHAVVAFMMLP